MTDKRKGKICFIAGASEIIPEDFVRLYRMYEEEAVCGADREEVLLIAADGGYSFLKEQGMEADLVVGDFDSLGYIPKHHHILRHPEQKDDTDMLLAVKEGLNRGCTIFYLFGGLGNRMDHSLANISVLSFLKKQGATGFLFGSRMHMTTLQNETIYFEPMSQGLISVFAIGDKAWNVTIAGLKYELTGGTMYRDFPIGVSNEFIGKESRISVADGELLVMWEDLEKEKITKLPRFLK